MKKAVIFDFAGVIVNSPKYIWQARNIWLEDNNYSFRLSNLDIKQLVGQSLKTQLEVINKKYSVNLDYSSFRDQTGEIQFDLMKKYEKPDPDLISFIDYLQDKKIPYLISSFNIRKNIVRELKLVGLENKFPNIISVESVSNPKDPFSRLTLASKILGAPLSDCIHIDDGVSGIKSASKLGAFAIGFNTEFNTEKALLDAGAKFTINSFKPYTLIL